MVHAHHTSFSSLSLSLALVFSLGSKAKPATRGLVHFSFSTRHFFFHVVRPRARGKQASPISIEEGTMSILDDRPSFLFSPLAKSKKAVRFLANREEEMESRNESFSFFLSSNFVAGGMAARGHPNDIDDSQSRHHEESSNSSLSQRSPDVVPPHTRGERIRQGMVHVPD